jgi:hypothetical protein
MDDEKSGAYVSPPSGSFTSWENTLCNPLGDMRTQAQSAWHDGYASAKVEREWVGLTDSERGKIFDVYGYGPIDVVAMCRAIEAKLKEKNA